MSDRITALRSTAQSASSGTAQSEASTRLQGSRLLIARIIWSIIIAFALGLFICSLFAYPRFFALATTPCSGLLSAILALLYVGLVLGLQFLFDRIAGPAAANSPIILVGSTLLIVALFRPLRRRIQSIIDRRFYRSKYDARRTIANFSATLRGVVELAQLSEQLVAIVEETMQPVHVSLGLNKPQQSRSAFSKQRDSEARAVS